MFHVGCIVIMLSAVEASVLSETLISRMQPRFFGQGSVVIFKFLPCIYPVQWGVLIHNIQNFFQKHQTSWISVSKLAIDP